MRAANEIRVGVVVVLGLALMIFGYFYLRGMGLGADLYYLRLDGAANVAVGNDVRLQGVKIGQVQDVSLDATTQKPLLTLAVKRHDPPFQLMQNYRYGVQTSAIIGESYVDIRGVYKSGYVAYQANDESQLIPGKAVAGFADVSEAASGLIRDFSTTLNKFNVTIDRVNKGVLSYENQVKLARTLTGVTRMTEQVGRSFGPQGIRLSFGDPRAQGSLNRTLANTAAAAQEASIAAQNIRYVTRDFRGILSENRGQVRDVLTSLSRMSANVAGLTETVHFIVKEGGFKENAQAAFAALRRAAENVEAGTSGIKAIGTDPATQKSLRDTIATLRETTEALRDTARSVQTLVNDPNTQGTVKNILTSLNTTATTLQSTMENLRDTSAGLKTSMQATADNLRDTTAGFKNVIGDPQVQSDLKAIPAELRGTLSATRATAERLNSFLGGRKKRESTQQSGGEKAQQRGYAPGGFDFTYRRFVGFRGKDRDGSDVDGRNYGDINFNAELFGNPFRAGLANIGEGTDVTLQSGAFIGKNTAVRYGLYRSKLGAGVDHRLGRFSLEGNLWNLNDASYNAYLGFRLTPNLEIIAGREHIRGVRANAIGVRLTP